MRLDVIIVSYRCEVVLRQCLASLNEHPASVPTRIQVVDNASNDGTAEMVAREFPDVELTVNSANLGFSAANTQAIRNSDAPYVLILNPDTLITEGALDRLIELLESRLEIGICGPRLVQDDGTFDHAAKRSFPTPIGALAHFTGIGRRDAGNGRLSQYRAPELGEFDAGPVDAVNGAFMLIRRAALDLVGPFDEGYWMYMEDLDLCYRFQEAGWVTWYEPSVTVGHAKAASSGRHRRLRLNQAFHYGMYRFYRSHYAADHNPAYNLGIYAGIGAKFAASAVRSAVARGLARVLR